MKLTFYTSLFEPDRPYLPERRLQKLWLNTLWKSKLTTLDGEVVQVLSPGMWNHHEGPDFRDAMLFIGEKMKEGDVEIHYGNGDWYRHGHHTDPAYDRVILHLIFNSIDKNKRVLNSKGEGIPVCLIDYSMLDIYEPEPVCRPEMKAPEVFFSILKQSGFERLKVKTDYIRRQSARFEYDLMCWWGLFQICGLSANRSSFNRVFIDFPWEDYFKGRLMKGDIPSLLQYITGLDLGFDVKNYSEYEKPDGLLWLKMGIRPPSLPENRLKWLSAFLVQKYCHSLYGDLMNALQERKLSKAFWKEFFRTDSLYCREPGYDLSVEMGMNALMPVVLASFELPNETMEKYMKDITTLSVNEYRVSHRFYNRHGIDNNNPLRRKWIHQQGILFINDRFCSQDLAELCPLCCSEVEVK